MQKRIIFISTEFPPGPGGIATHTYQVAMGLTRRGWQVLVLSTQDDATADEIRTFNAAQPFRVVRLRRWPLAVLEGLYRLGLLFYWFLRFRPEAGMAVGERAVWLMALLGRAARLPWLAFGIATEFTVIAPWVRSLTRWAFNGASRLVAISDYTRRQMTALGISAGPIRVIPCGADDHLYRVVDPGRALAFRRRLGLEQPRLLLTVGRVTERKGQDVVIQALPHLLAAGLDVHYLMIGVPVLGKQMEELAGRLGVAERVHLLGRLDDETVVDACNACDVFVMTSRHTDTGGFEGFGIAAVEAALCAKPAVVSEQSGLVEAVVDGVTALVVPLHDPQATAAAIARLLSNPELYRRLASQALRHAREEQTWDQRLDDIQAEIEAMLGRGQSATSQE
jgi:phosphatidylinositol alpha-1,6-mannosyltransferase